MVGLTMSPDFQLYRTVTDAADSLPETDIDKGLNTADYEDLIIEVVPTGCDPTIEVLFWSESASAFIKEHTAMSYAGIGSGVAFQVRVNSFGRKLFVAVTGTIGAGDVIVLNVAGWR